MIKNIALLIIVTVTLLSCTSVKETLSFKKKEGVDEFLIEKKIP